MTKKILTQEYLKECVHYDPETGVFTWKVRPRDHFNTDRGWRCFNSRNSGGVAGSLTHYGYLTIRIGVGNLYFCHRLAWMYVHGETPIGDIDHINHIRTDNRLENLRSVSRKENCKNRKASGNFILGVNKTKSNKWNARIRHEYKSINLGVYDTLHEAIEVRKAAERSYGFHPSHGA